MLKQPINGGLSLLVRNSTGVEDVLGALLTLVLNWVEEEVILGFVNREHCLPACRRPAAENNGNLVGVDQLLRLLCESGPIRGAIFRGVGDFVALAVDLDTAGCIDFFDRHLLDFFQSRFGDRHRSAQGMKDTDFDFTIKVATTTSGITTATATGGHCHSHCCGSERSEKTLRKR